MDGASLLASATPDLAQTLLEFGLLLLGCGILARVAAAIGISPVPLYLLVGLVFGDGGVAELGVNGDLTKAAAEIGAILLLLLLGLEYSSDKLVGTVRTQWRAGLIDIVLNSLPGAICALILGWGLIGAIALAGITYISSSGIVSQVVRDLKWSRKTETPGVVGLLIIEDVVMAPYLPIVTALATGAGVAAGLISVGIALVVIAIVVLLSLRKMHILTRMLDANQPVSLLLTVFGATLAVAGLATIANFSSAVAAFLVGLVLTGEVAEVARKRLAPLRDLFAAVFFVFFGLSTDPGDIWPVLPAALALSIVAIATKMITGWFVARKARSSRAGRVRAGALLVARGEFSILIAGIVAVSPNTPDGLVAFSTAFVLITAVAGPVIARFAEPLSDRFTRNRRAKVQAA